MERREKLSLLKTCMALLSVEDLLYSSAVLRDTVKSSE